MKSEILQKIQDELARMDCELVSVYQHQHPGDYYLQVVLARRRYDDTYITWGHNSDCGGMFGGHYDMTLDEAKSDFADRIKGK